MAHHLCSRTIAAALCALGLAASLPAFAQKATSSAAPIKRTEVFRGDVAAAGHEAVLMKVEVAPGGHAGRHTHPGDEISYVVDGNPTLQVDGEPPRQLKPGDGFVVKAGQVHDALNNGSTPVHLIGVYVVEKGKPLATPAK
jgi:quercetin dioxygenase-like cupin family protein